MWKARISVPKSVSRGDTAEIKTLIAHPMESGFRRDNLGRQMPRNILVSFEVRMNGDLVFETRLFPGIAANPYLSFYLKFDTTSELEFLWRDQHGIEHREKRQVQIH
ncbi:MAG: thiosulfate oxidation carrier complex protein SoxZ [Pseudomonadales bacterium]|nr:thiosulfate oxidation carrier complex protein SoxZ [Pseudomonadales bacterium]